MPAVIFEIFGYPIDDHSVEAEQNRLAARCPFMGRDCDGGGNRYLSQINLTEGSHIELQAKYPGRTTLPAGVCSLQLAPQTTPWIVCPRRLLVLGRERAGERTHQKNAETTALRLLGYPSGTRLGVWSEVKLKYNETVTDLDMSFDYTFDYILMPVGSMRQQDIEAITRLPWARMRKNFEAGGYTIAHRQDGFYVEDCPYGNPGIIEIMTSSTSGGDKSKRSTIPAAFEDALLQRPNLKAPGINYRQVWARMVSQLIVKSEIGLNWGGKTLWIVQDALVDYICAKTALNIRHFLSEQTHEVNMLSFSYGEAYHNPNGVLDLGDAELFAGPMSTTPPGTPTPASFQDMIRAPIKPPLERLINLLAKRKPNNYVTAP